MEGNHTIISGIVGLGIVAVIVMTPTPMLLQTENNNNSEWQAHRLFRGAANASDRKEHRSSKLKRRHGKGCDKRKIASITEVL